MRNTMLTSGNHGIFHQTEETIRTVEKKHKLTYELEDSVHQIPSDSNIHML